MTTNSTTADGFGVRRGRRMAAVAALGVVGALGASAAPAAAAGPLDQASTGEPDECIWIGESVPLAQTFTAGVTGDLDRVTVWLGRTASSPVMPVDIEIRDVVAGEPVATVLASTSVAGTSVPVDDTGPVAVDLPPVPVVAGTQYALIVISAAPEFPPSYCYEGYRNPDVDAYVGGAASVYFGGSWHSILDADDFGFETYVTPAPPEPPAPPAEPNGLVSGLLGDLVDVLPVLAPIVNPIRGLLGSLGL